MLLVLIHRQSRRLPQFRGTKIITWRPARHARLPNRRDGLIVTGREGGPNGAAPDGEELAYAWWYLVPVHDGGRGADRRSRGRSCCASCAMPGPTGGTWPACSSPSCSPRRSRLPRRSSSARLIDQVLPARDLHGLDLADRDPGADPHPEQRHRRRAAPLERRRGRRRHLRPALVAVCRAFSACRCASSPIPAWAS